MKTTQSDADKFYDLIKDIRFTMMTTVAPDGSFHSRPMATLKNQPDGSLWFFTKQQSPKAHEIFDNGRVSLAYSKPEDNCYVAVTGSAEVVKDAAKAKEFWNPLYKAWFPEGLEDPELALLKVTVEKAEYWDSPSSKMVQVAGFIKALVTGEPRKPGPDEHKKIDLNS